MKKLLLFVLSFLAASVAFTVYGESPYQPHVAERFRQVENGALRLLKVPYSFTATNAASGDNISTGKSLPADAIVVDSFLYVDEALTGASDNTVAVSCESTGDLFAASGLTSHSQHDLIQGAVSGISTGLRSSDGCDIEIDIGAGVTGLTAGRLVILLKYFLPEYVR